MAVSSGAYGPWLRDMGLNVKAFDMDTDSFKYGLVNDTHTPDFNTHDEYADITNEVSGTGWAAGGVVLVSPTWTIGSGFCTWDANDVSETGTTLTNLEAGFSYDDTLAGDPLIFMVDFGSAYSTVAGTLTITHDANGLLRIDYIP